MAPDALEDAVGRVTWIELQPDDVGLVIQADDTCDDGFTVTVLFGRLMKLVRMHPSMLVVENYSSFALEQHLSGTM